MEKILYILVTFSCFLTLLVCMVKIDTNLPSHGRKSRKQLYHYNNIMRSPTLTILHGSSKCSCKYMYDSFLPLKITTCIIMLYKRFMQKEKLVFTISLFLCRYIVFCGRFIPRFCTN